MIWVFEPLLILLMGSFILGTFVATAAVVCFALYHAIKFHQGNKKIDSSSLSPSSPPPVKMIRKTKKRKVLKLTKKMKEAKEVPPSPIPSPLPPSSSLSSESSSSYLSLSPFQPFSSSSSSSSSSLSSSSLSLSSSSSSSSLSFSSPQPFSSASPPPSSSSHSHGCAHDVFPSFHGKDIRKTFLSHTLKESKRMGINFFVDNDMERGKSIGQELRNAIRGSKVSIVMLSKNYGSSSWCLDELVEILRCRVEGQTVMTVFYEVEPTDVKKQTGDFGVAFRNTCVGRENDEIERWREALVEVATIAGETSSNWDGEAAMIDKIVCDVWNTLHNSPSGSDFDRLVGMGAHMEKMERLLSLELVDEVRIIGIWGPSGIGKTTIARSLFRKFSRRFQHIVFMEDIKASMSRIPCSDDHSAKLALQQQLLSQMFEKNVKISDLKTAQSRLKDKKVLVVLDGVDHLMQLEAMAEETSWFGRGSRIVITTQDKRMLEAPGIHHIYEVDFPPPHESLEIFCMSAFRQNSPSEGFKKLSWEATNLSGNLPLGLKVMGSYFRGMSKQRWKKEISMLRTSLDGEIASILKLCYDALNEKNKELFLYIARLFNNESIEKLEVYLAKNFVDVRQSLDVLAEKCLISIEANKITMHDLLVQLGREIPCHEHGNRRILVDGRDISEVLTNDTGSGNDIGMNFNLSELSGDLNISERAFEGLPNLQFLRFHYPIGNRRNLLHLPRGLNSLPRSIRVLHWEDFRMKRLPFSFNTEHLVKLNMHGSKLEKLWEGIQPLGNLRWMNLSNSEDLKELPDLSSAVNLEVLDSNNCTSLMELPFSIGNAVNLSKLRLFHCSSLVSLPSSIGEITHLQILDLSYCSSLVKLPSSFGNLINLSELDLSHCSSLVELPSSIGTNLLHLNLKGCSSLVGLPSSIGNAPNLQKLYLNNCSSLAELPSSIGNACNLQKLDLSNCSGLMKLPSSIGNAISLLYLNLLGCSQLVKLPSSIGNLTNLKTLFLNNCSSLVELPASIGNASSLEKLDMSNCSSLVELPSSIGNATNLRKLKLINCSSLLELPSSIGNLYKLHLLSLKGCSKLKVLPIKINMKSLHELDLSDCSLLKTFPKISTSIGLLRLNGTAIKEVPLSIQSWHRLSKLQMSYCESLKENPYALKRITELHLSNTEVQELMPWVIEISNLRRFVLNGCRKLVSIPQLSDSLSSLHAANCESLVKLDCSFHNPQIRLNFVNCFNLNKEARALIIHTPTRRHAILPGGEVPASFTYRATGGSLTVKLNERPLPKSLRFKACILLFCKGDDDTEEDESLMSVCTRIREKQNDLTVRGTPRQQYLPPPLAEHLYIFQIEAAVTSTELLFVFDVHLDNWEIGACGVFELMEVPLFHEHDVSSDSDIGGKY